ncbi:MAG: alpha-glucosidase [Mycoplasmatales bacterium]
MNNNLTNKVIYQIYPKSFLDTTGSGIGDINGIIKKLDYLKDLGVDYLWLSPICLSPQNDNGYDIADYYHIDPIFGTDEDYFQLIAEAKKRNIKIMLDLVLNHTSSEHEWFKKALAGEKKYQDYYIWSDTPNNLMSAFGNSAWTFSQAVGKYYLHLFDKTQPDLNWENEEVKTEIFQMINYWLDKGVEGFRLDVIDLIGKEPEKEITVGGKNFHNLLKELRDNTFQDKVLTVGECWGSNPESATKMTGVNGMTQIFHFEHINWMHPKWVADKLTTKQLANLTYKWQNEYNGIETLVWNNHDLPRQVSHLLNDQDYREVCCKLLFAYNVFLSGNIYIYQGEEIGMTNVNFEDINDYNDVETKNKYTELLTSGLSNSEAINIVKGISRDNARTPMQWTASINAGFTSGNPWLKINDNFKYINVEANLSDENSVFNFYKKLINYRKANSESINAKLDFIVEKNGVIQYKKNSLNVFANFTKETKIIKENGQVIFSNYEDNELNKLLPYQIKVIKDI